MNSQKIIMNKKIDLKKLKIVMGDDYPVILLNSKPLSHLISWDIKKKLVKEIINETELNTEHMYKECSRIANDEMAGFFLSVGNDWIRKDNWNSSVLLSRFQLKQLINLINLNIDEAEILLKKILKKNSFSKVNLKKKLKNIYYFFEILFSSFIISVFNIFKKRNHEEVSILYFTTRIKKKNSNPSKIKKIKKIKPNSQIGLRELYKFFLKTQNTEYEFVTIIDWFKTLKSSINYYIVWRKFLFKLNSNKNFYKQIDNSFVSIFNSVFQYNAILKLLYYTKAKYVVCDSTPNRPYLRRLFFSASKAGACTIHALTKVIFGNNSGYKFNFKKMKCDQLGIAEKFFVSTESAKNILLKNGVDEKNIKVKKEDDNEQYPIKNKLNFKNSKNIILLCLNMYKGVNIEMVRVIKNYIDKKDIKLLIKSHPLLDLNEQSLFNSSDKFTDVSDMSFDEIDKKYCGPDVRAVAITNQSTALCKSLRFNFMPIWLSFIGEATILYSELLDNVGKFVNDSDSFQGILDSCFHNSNFKEELNEEKKKSKIYIDNILYESDVENFISNYSFEKKNI
jgi:hypothetical protein